MRARQAAIVLGLLLSVASGCSKKPAPATTATKALRRKPKTNAQLPSTEADTWLGNLDGQISELTRLLVERPENTTNLGRLSATHHTRGRYRGDLDEIQLGIDEASTCIRLEPDNGAFPLLRAEQEQSLHRFEEARADLEAARRLQGDPRRIADLATELDWNDGVYDAPTAAIRKARAERPSTATWMREAQLDNDLGASQDVVDAAFEAAEDRITDTGPMPIAHLDVQRGMQRAQRGLLDEAAVFFREASARMPGYVASNEHLAEILHMQGKDDEAVAIYEKVVAASADPEFQHALGALYAAHGRPEEARALEAKARAGYEALLVKYPEAMYWHASEFFVSIGDARRALELLKKNLVLRPNGASYVALAHAELLNDHVPEARAAIDRALAMPLRSATLFWTAQTIYRRAGETARADELAALAKALNPRVDRD